MYHGTIGEMIKESESWKTRVQQLDNEKIRAKMRLSDILSRDIREERQDILEDLWKRFEKIDSEIALLKHEVREHIYQLNAPLLLRSLTPQKLTQFHKNIEVKVIVLHTNFERLSEAIHKCMEPIEK